MNKIFENVKNTNIISFVIIGFNLFASIMHFLYQIQIAKSEGLLFKEFLLVENLIVAFIFLYVSVSLMIMNYDSKQNILIFNSFLYGVLIISVTLYKPKDCTLSMIKILDPINKSYILLLFGVTSLILSIIAYINYTKAKKKLLLRKD